MNKKLLLALLLSITLLAPQHFSIAQDDEEPLLQIFVGEQYLLIHAPTTTTGDGFISLEGFGIRGQRDGQPVTEYLSDQPAFVNMRWGAIETPTCFIFEVPNQEPDDYPPFCPSPSTFVQQVEEDERFWWDQQQVIFFIVQENAPDDIASCGNRNQLCNIEAFPQSPATPLTQAPISTVQSTSAPINTPTPPAQGAPSPTETPASSGVGVIYIAPGAEILMRAQPSSDSPEVLRLGAGLTVQLSTQIVDGWIYVTRIEEGFRQSGWIELQYIAVPTPTATPLPICDELGDALYSATVNTTTNIILRETSDPNSNEVVRLAPGAIVSVLAEDGDRAYVSVPTDQIHCQTGWTPREFLLLRP